MDCLNKICRSPIACDGFGYCRERNFKQSPLNELMQDLIVRLIPYIEDLRKDPCYKPDHINQLLKEMRRYV